MSAIYLHNVRYTAQRIWIHIQRWIAAMFILWYITVDVDFLVFLFAWWTICMHANRPAAVDVRTIKLYYITAKIKLTVTVWIK